MYLRITSYAGAPFLRIPAYNFANAYFSFVRDWDLMIEFVLAFMRIEHTHACMGTYFLFVRTKGSDSKKRVIIITIRFIERVKKSKKKNNWAREGVTVYVLHIYADYHQKPAGIV